MANICSQSRKIKVKYFQCDFFVTLVISRSRTGERSDQFKCLDDNECVIGNNYCVDEEKGGICLNIDGSFTCTCQEGYTGDGNDYQKYTRLTQSGSGSKLIYDY